MADVKFIRSIVSSIPTTVDLTATGNVLQAEQFQVTDSGVTASKPAKFDANKKFTSGDINLTSEVTGVLPIANGGTNSSAALNNNRVVQSSGGAIVEAAAITASRALISDANGIPTHSDVTSAELAHLDGVTSNIQTQLNAITSSYGRRKTVLGYIVDNTVAPPTEVSGDRYILSHDGGSPHADWDGAAANDIVEFNGTSWVAITPSEGWICYNDGDDSDYLQIDDGTPQWEKRATQSTALADGKIWIGNVSGQATEQTLTGDVTVSNGGVTAIGSGVIVNADINSSAAIALSKLESITEAYILVGPVGNGAPAAVAMSGDITIGATGATAIGSGVIVDADVNASAAIALSKLASGTDGQIIVANGSGVPAYVAMSGDVTISNAGVTAIGSGVIVDADINASAAIATSKLADASKFLLNDTNRSISDTVRYTYGTAQTFSNDGDLVTKKYVDEAVVAAAPNTMTFTATAGESFSANTTYVVRWAVSGETAKRVYKATSDEQNASGKYRAIGFIRPTGAITAGDSVTVVKFDDEVALLSSDSVIGASAADNGKIVYLNKDGAFSLNPATGITTGETYAIFMLGILKEYNATVTSEAISIDVSIGGFQGIDIGP